MTDEMGHLALFKALSEGQVSCRHVRDVTGLSWGEVIVAMNNHGLRLPRVDPGLFLSDERRAFEDAVWEEIARRHHAKKAEKLVGDGSDCLMQERMTIVIADAEILGQLVSNKLIDELTDISSIVVIPDLVAIEAVMPEKPFARAVNQWLQSGTISVVSTTTGEMLRAALTGNPSFRARNAIDRAIIDWLLETIDAVALPVTVVCSNSNVARLIERHDADANTSWGTMDKFHQAVLDRSLTSDERTSIIVISQDGTDRENG